VVNFFPGGELILISLLSGFSSFHSSSRKFADWFGFGPFVFWLDRFGLCGTTLVFHGGLGILKPHQLGKGEAHLCEGTQGDCLEVSGG